VTVPTSAQPVSFNDERTATTGRSVPATPSRPPAPGNEHTSGSAQPGDDHGGLGTLGTTSRRSSGGAEPSDDRGGTRTITGVVTPPPPTGADDHGGVHDRGK
jgi:hypothetical protein